MNLRPQETVYFLENFRKKKIKQERIIKQSASYTWPFSSQPKEASPG